MIRALALALILCAPAQAALRLRRRRARAGRRLSALSDDAYALYYNPSGLAQLGARSFRRLIPSFTRAFRFNIGHLVVYAHP